MPRSAGPLVRLLPASDSALADTPLLRAFESTRSDDAFEQLVRRHGPMVLATCRRVLGNPDDAEDAFQAVFIVLARKASTVRGNLAGWLYAVALRTARGVRIMRERRRKYETLASMRSEPAVLQGTDQDLAAVFDEELVRLPEYYREAVVLCELRGLSRKQAASELGIPEGTLSSRLAAAKRKLAVQLSARGLEAPALLAAVLAPASVSAGLVESAVRGTAGPVAGAVASTVIKAMLLDQLKAMTLAAGMLLTLACGGWAMTGTSGGSNPAQATVPVAQIAQDPAAKLVEHLGAQEFDDRENATKELRVLGLKAEPALRSGLKSENPEVRERSARLLIAIRSDARGALAKGFDPSTAVEPDHPIWKRFKTIAGNDAAARKLFAELIADPRRLKTLDDAERDPDRAGEIYAAELERWYTFVQKLLDRPTTGTVSPKETPYPEAVAVMYLGTYPASKGKAKEGWRWEGHLFIDSWSEVMTSPVGPAVKRIFAAWLTVRDNPDTRERGFAIAAGYRVKEVLPLARKVLADEKEVAEQRAQCALILGILGNHDDSPLLRRVAEAKLANEPFRQFNVFFAGQAELDALWGKKRFGVKVDPDEAKRVYNKADTRTCNRTVADCAWSAAVYLAGGKPQDLGFLWPRTVLGGEIDDRWYAEIHSHGFPDEASRTAAHAKARAFLDEQPTTEPKKEEPKTDPVVAKLVEQLGAPEFADREAAGKQLRSLGVPAIPTLKVALKSVNPEVRQRATKILVEIRGDQLQAFVTGFDSAKVAQPAHPVWKRFVALAGNSPASRELFARIIANKKWLQTLDNAEADLTSAGHIYRVGIAEVFRDFDRNPAKDPEWPCNRGEEVAYLLFLGSYVDLPQAELTGDEIVPTNLRNTEFLGRGIIHGEGQITHARGLALGLQGELLDTSKGINAPVVAGAAGTDRIFARLFAAWLVRHDVSSEVVPPAFRIASMQRVPEILPLARRYAANDFEPNRKVPANATIAALELVAQLGKRADLPLFERHFADETRVAVERETRNFAPLPPPNTTELRDVALGLALLLHGGNPEDFGFFVRKGAFNQKDGRYEIPWYSHFQLGFENEANRTAAFKKAKAWLIAENEQVPKSPNKLIFYRAGNLNLIDPEGKNEKKVSEDGDKFYLGGARLSPDGKRIAYVVHVEKYLVPEKGNRLPQRHLYVKDLDEKGPGTDLGGFRCKGYDFAWSPNGSQLAVSEETAHHIIDIKTKEKTALNLPKDHFLTDWSPDGKYFLTTMIDGVFTPDSIPDARLYLMKRDGTEHKVLTEAKHFNAFGRLSPDGKRVLYCSLSLASENDPGGWHLNILDIATGKSNEVEDMP
ncbi:MAG TPA: sigma-70 family RNA polymerase sigma factor, partial [Gemmata sp.]|nr:sigma-70 family RNA polymerase sigma factor [Gemmata sp.]